MTVQGEIETAIKKLTGETVTIQGAGRTDAGVHALGQVAHFDLVKPVETDTIRDALERASAPASDRGARRRKTCRTISTRACPRPSGIISIASSTGGADLALERLRAWRVPRRLDERAMHEAAQRLVGHHDFTTFRSTECQAKSPMRTLDRLDVTRDGDDDQHRSLGALVPAQSGALDGGLARPGRRRQMERGRSRAALAARDRTACAPVAPPEGLYLVKVDY